MFIWFIYFSCWSSQYKGKYIHSLIVITNRFRMHLFLMRYITAVYTKYSVFNSTAPIPGERLNTDHVNTVNAVWVHSDWKVLLKTNPSPNPSPNPGLNPSSNPIPNASSNHSLNPRPNPSLKGKFHNRISLVISPSPHSKC